MGAKGVILTMWVAAALCACGRDDVLFMGYRTRSEIMGGKPGARQEDSEYREGENTGTPDTVLFACGVEWPEDYDWRRDSCAGAVRGKLVLFRKGCLPGRCNATVPSHLPAETP